MARLILMYTKDSSREDTVWADQFLEANDEVMAEKKGLALERGRVAIPRHATWDDFQSKVEEAAGLACEGGVVMLLGGHSASGCFDQNTGKPTQVCDAAGSRTATVWLDPDKKLRFDQDAVFY